MIGQLFIAYDLKFYLFIIYYFIYLFIIKLMI